ncbi:MAG: hypothetical protein JO197_09695 [Acidobacteria bacterium]|nr:hypothetical protein [Acidobacteriota bacterium]MBV9477369.1 hypothetical protein [Acidobacteriota bacterium]
MNIDYLYFDLALLAAVMSFAWPAVTLEDLRSGRLWSTSVVLIALWFIVDQIALETGVWYFPAEGTLPIRVARLPLEEWLALFGHTVITRLVLRNTLRRGART